MRVAQLAIALAGVLAAGPLRADETDRTAEFIEEGRKLAERVCARCHDVTPGGAQRQSPPSFAAIAAYRSAEHIRQSIMAPRPDSAMPDVGLVWGNGHKDVVVWYPGQTDHLVAYIISLDRR